MQKIRFATKIPKNQCYTTSTKGRCDTSHGQRGWKQIHEYITPWFSVVP